MQLICRNEQFNSYKNTQEKLKISNIHVDSIINFSYLHNDRVQAIRE